MQRVIVCGCSGSGKSTFARRLAALTGLPYVSLDALYWQPGWVPGRDEDLRARLGPVIAHERWIIDGNYFTALGAAHLPRATHVYWFDLPRWRCLSGAFRRIAGSYGKVRPEMAPGCPERIDPEFFRYIWTYRERQRPKVIAHLAAMRPDQRLSVFTRRAAADAMLAALSGAQRAGTLAAPSGQPDLGGGESAIRSN